MNNKSSEWPSWQPEKPEKPETLPNAKAKQGNNNQEIKRGRGRPRKDGMEKQSTSHMDGKILNYEWVLDRRSVSFLVKIQEEQECITKDQLVQLKELFSLDYDRLAEMMGVTNRALHLRKGNDRLNRNMSERLLAIVEIYCAGYNVFGSRDGFHEWLDSPSRSFGDRCPMSFLSSLTGMYEVRQQIYRIDNFML